MMILGKLRSAIGMKSNGLEFPCSLWRFSRLACEVATQSERLALAIASACVDRPFHSETRMRNPEEHPSPQGFYLAHITLGMKKDPFYTNIRNTIPPKI